MGEPGIILVIEGGKVENSVVDGEADQRRKAVQQEKKIAVGISAEIDVASMKFEGGYTCKVLRSTKTKWQTYACNPKIL